MKIYIAGKITGNPSYAQHFGRVQEELEDQGHVVLSPCVFTAGLTQEEYMHMCLAMIDVSEGVMFLSNWKESKGAQEEHAYAVKHAKNMFYENEVNTYKTLLGGQCMSFSKVMKDSGKRETYSTGAKREPVADKEMRPELFSPEALIRDAKWYAQGASKYGDRNWEKGIPFTNCIGSMLRHIIKYMNGQDDEDHLAAIRWNAGALCHYEKYNPDLDDRPAWTYGNQSVTTQESKNSTPIEEHEETGPELSPEAVLLDSLSDDMLKRELWARHQKKILENDPELQSILASIKEMF